MTPDPRSHIDKTAGPRENALTRQPREEAEFEREDRGRIRCRIVIWQDFV